MTGYSDGIQANTHQSRHYESCLNSTCSRSPSPVRRELWEPKHVHSPSLNLKSNKKLPLKPFDTTKQTSSTRSRDKSPFLPPPRDFNGTSTPNRSPLFTYTINKDSANNDNQTKHFEIRIQKQFDSSPPSSRCRTPEVSLSNPFVKDQVAAGNLELNLKLDTSHVPPIITIKNSTSLSNAQQAVPLASSTPPTTCTRSCCCSSSCCSHQRPCSPSQTTESCDFICQPCPYLSSPRSNLKVDKATSPATSPTKPISTPPELEPCISVGQCFPKFCPYLSTTKEDKAVSPIYPRSRSPSPCSISASPCPQQSSSPKSILDHSSHGSDVSSRASIDIKFDEGSKLHIDWEEGAGPIEVDFPITSGRGQKNRSDDQVHSYKPQLEAFYTSSNNQSRALSPCRSRSVSPSSPLSEGHSSRSAVLCPPWSKPCNRNSYGSFNKSQLESNCPSRCPCSSPSTSYSRSPESKSLSTKALSRNNSANSLTICSEDGEIITNIDWSCPTSNVDPRDSFQNPPRVKYGINDDHLETHKQSLSPILTLTPPAVANGQMTIEWSPRSDDERRCEGMRTVVLNKKTSKGDYEDLRPSYLHNEGKEEEREPRPQVIPQPYNLPYKHLTSPNANLEYTDLLQSKDSTCVSSCKSPCTLACCAPPCDPCQVSQECCDGCCCCYSQDCVVPIDGINSCTSLPPHLQSDWSANLRSPPGELRTKPILYRDMQGHEHIMFADGSIEHLSRHCEPTPATRQQPAKPPPAAPLMTFAMPCLSPPFSPPSYCQHLFHCKEEKSDHHHAHNFSPQSGDIVIRAHQRLPCMYPGKDNGQVAFFSSDYLDLREGDSIVRLGKFDNSGQWSSSKVVEMYLRGSHGQWTFLGTTEGHSKLYPVEADTHQAVRTPNKQLKLRQGDLVISTIPGPSSFYFWNPKRKVDVDHSHLLLRAYIGHPQVVDEHHNLACCVPGHLPVGYAELYVKVKRLWLFLGRDDHMFSEHELMHFS